MSAANPIRCVGRATARATLSARRKPPSPTAPQPPELGGAASFGTADGSMWDIPMGLGWEVQVPVVASASGSTAVEFAVRIADAEDNPVINVTSGYVPVAPASTLPPIIPPSPVPAEASVAATVAPVVKLDKTRGKVRCKPVAGPVGPTARLAVRARVSGKWVVLGKTAYEVSGATATTSRSGWRRSGARPLMASGSRRSSSRRSRHRRRHGDHRDHVRAEGVSRMRTLSFSRTAAVAVPLLVLTGGIGLVPAPAEAAYPGVAATISSRATGTATLTSNR